MYEYNLLYFFGYTYSFNNNSNKMDVEIVTFTNLRFRMLDNKYDNIIF